MSKIAILTSGGDSPGMNAAVRAAVRTSIHQGLEVTGVIQGYQGLIEANFQPLDLRSVANIIQRGGTILKSGRCPQFQRVDSQQTAVQNLESQGIDKLLVIGGDGSFRGGLALSSTSTIQVVGIPATIDNDIGGTEYTIGFDTAVNTALMSIDRIRDTAASHDRVFIVEVMGRNSGFLAAQVGLAGGAEAVFVPEQVLSVDAVIDKINQSAKKGKNSSILITAEGQKPGRAYDLAEAIRKKGGIDPRVCVLGHVQRGGTPSARDRIIASQMGAAAVNAAVANRGGNYIGLQNGAFVEVPLSHVEQSKSLDPSLLPLTEILSL